MAKIKKYRFNPKTLSYEVSMRSRRDKMLRFAGFAVGSIALSVLYFWLYVSVFGLELPKTTILKKENAQWCSKLEVMNRNLDKYDDVLSSLQVRDDDIYRSIFGMHEIPSEARNAGFGGVNRYEYLDAAGAGKMLKATVIRLDVLTKKTFVQSRSFDDVAQFSKRAGDMASCVPAISPIVPDRNIYRLSSSFGYRSDPFTGKSRRHAGVDFALKPGNPIYATGDGVVESVKFELFGYGNSVVIDHGFGYKTRYAHLKTICVAEGMEVKRGECIGESGNSGRSSGPHLHYEVIYRDKHVNPSNYYDLTITPEEYSTMVQEVADASEKLTMHPSHVKGK